MKAYTLWHPTKLFPNLIILIHNQRKSLSETCTPFCVKLRLNYAQYSKGWFRQLQKLLICDSYGFHSVKWLAKKIIPRILVSTQKRIWRHAISTTWRNYCMESANQKCGWFGSRSILIWAPLRMFENSELQRG